MFDDLNPARTAHLIITMQNCYVEEGAPLEVPLARSVVPQINAIAARAPRATLCR
jgi:ureidoacrylate peracid hydrolase